MITFKDEDHFNLVMAYVDGISALNHVTGQAHEFTLDHDPAMESVLICDEPEGPMRTLVLDFRGWRHTAMHDTCTCDKYDCDHFTKFMQVCLVTRLLEIALGQVEKANTGDVNATIERLLKLVNVEEKVDDLIRDIQRNPE